MGKEQLRKIDSLRLPTSYSLQLQQHSQRPLKLPIQLSVQRHRLRRPKRVQALSPNLQPHRQPLFHSLNLLLQAASDERKEPRGTLLCRVGVAFIGHHVCPPIERVLPEHATPLQSRLRPVQPQGWLQPLRGPALHCYCGRRLLHHRAPAQFGILQAPALNLSADHAATNVHGETRFESVQVSSRPARRRSGCPAGMNVLR